jgi:hypothetical protein
MTFPLSLLQPGLSIIEDFVRGRIMGKAGCSLVSVAPVSAYAGRTLRAVLRVALSEDAQNLLR